MGGGRPACAADTFTSVSTILDGVGALREARFHGGLLTRELVQQLLEGAAGVVEAGGSDQLRPVLLDLGNTVGSTADNPRAVVCGSSGCPAWRSQ